MKDFIKKHFAILLAFLLPLILIVVVALNVYLPSLFLSTKYDFVYSVCTDGTNYYYYNCNNYLQKRYTVVGDRLVTNNIDPLQDSDNDTIPDIKENYTTRVFLHNTKENESREISFQEAQALSLSDLLTSPDGVTVSSNYDNRGGDFFLFPFGGGYSSSYGYYLTKGKSKDRLNLINNGDQYYSRDNFEFLGWVLPASH